MIAPSQPSTVRSMFARIARRYDRMNRLMTLGRYDTWCRRVVALARLPERGRLLDLGAGTGDLALEAVRRRPALSTVAADFTVEMMRVGRERRSGRHVRWAAADALNLPFPRNTFDAVACGYLMRNVADVDRGWAEQFRVLKPGGRVVCIDTTPPPRNALRPVVNFHLHTVIPLLGGLVAGDSRAYTYLPESTESFLPAERLAERMRRAGFQQVQFERRMFGTVAIHTGVKPA